MPFTTSSSPGGTLPGPLMVPQVYPNGLAARPWLSRELSTSRPARKERWRCRYFNFVPLRQLRALRARLLLQTMCAETAHARRFTACASSLAFAPVALFPLRFFFIIGRAKMQPKTSPSPQALQPRVTFVEERVVDGNSVAVFWRRPVADGHLLILRPVLESHHGPLRMMVSRRWILEEKQGNTKKK